MPNHLVTIQNYYNQTKLDSFKGKPLILFVSLIYYHSLVDAFTVGYDLNPLIIRILALSDQFYSLHTI